MVATNVLLRLKPLNYVGDLYGYYERYSILSSISAGVVLDFSVAQTTTICPGQKRAF